MTITVKGINGLSDEIAQSCFDLAETYLRQSDLAGFLIDELKRIDEVLTINVEAGDPINNGNTWAPPQDGSAGVVNWNIKRTLLATEKVADQPDATAFQKFLAKFTSDKQETMSPALLLMHEMGHACQYMSGNEGDMFNATVNEIENINVNAIENTVAKELQAAGNIEGIRWRYRDAQTQANA